MKCSKKWDGKRLAVGLQVPVKSGNGREKGRKVSVRSESSHLYKETDLGLGNV
jgi:hypothetical protein